MEIQHYDILSSADEAEAFAIEAAFQEEVKRALSMIEGVVPPGNSDWITFVLLLLSTARYKYLEKVEAGAYLVDTIRKGENHQLHFEEILLKLAEGCSPVQLDRKLLGVLHEIRKGESFRANFGAFFEATLKHLSGKWGKSSNGRLASNHVSRELLKYVDLPKRARIYNPFAGFGSLALNLPEDSTYLGQEIDQAKCNLARLRLAIHGKEADAGFIVECSDSILNTPNRERFDLVISNPPLGLRLKNYSKFITESRLAENWVIEHGVDLLKEDGQLVVLVTMGFLFRGGADEKIRKRLIKEDLIDRIIKVPANSPFASIPTAVLVLSKQKSLKQKIRVGDPTAKASVMNLDDFESIFQIGFEQQFRLLGESSGAVRPSSQMKLISNEDVIAAGYNLLPERYLMQEVEGILLNEILLEIKGERVRETIHGDLLSIKNLLPEKNAGVTGIGQIVRERGSIESVLYSEIPKGSIRINQNALLIAIKGRNLRPTFFVKSEKDSRPFYLSRKVKAFKVDYNKVYPAYLVYQLRNSVTQQQLEAYRFGSTIPQLRVNDFLRVRISLPSVDEQKAIMNELSRIEKDMEQLRKERDALAHGQQVQDDKRYAALTHTLGRPAHSILTGAKVIMNFITSLGEEGESLNQRYAVGPGRGRNLSATLQSFRKDIDFIKRTIDRGDNGFAVEAYSKTEVLLSDIPSIVKGLGISGLRFDLQINVESDASWKAASVKISPELLRILLENLITNANKHGFTSKQPGNLMQVNIGAVDGFLTLDIRNNGAPFPSKINRDAYIQEFRTSDDSIGQGFGGHHINLIARYFENPDWELILDEHGSFPVQFVFRLPILLNEGQKL
ncbi:N-6 DNA methylase [Neolewinella persica]|uniref:N-6 DNA methylase n=1 Tax=Neolewinella persica TaxID=70998 RepID=UPI0003734470|nr:N-6 DNA methylase [Neolewinella persica]